MAINFDALPQDRPNNIPNPGTYYATIESAEPKVSKAGSNMLALKLKLQDKAGKNAGIVFDNLIESDKSFLLFKISRFCRALELSLTGSFELRDLSKIVVGKQLIVDIKEGEFNGNKKAEVDMSKGTFYPITEASELFGNTAGLAMASGMSINATDAADSFVPTSDGNIVY